MVEVFFSFSACSRMKGLIARGVFPQGTAVCYDEDLSLGTLIPQTNQARVSQLQSYGLPVTQEELEKRNKPFWEAFASSNEFRVWTSDSPYEAVGLCWFCWVCQNKSGAPKKILVCSLSNLPDTQAIDINTMEEEEWKLLAEHQKWVDTEGYARRWERMLAENTPLRLSIDEKLCSVEEDFFDEKLLEWMEKGEDSLDAACHVADWWREEKHQLVNVYFLIARAEKITGRTSD